MIKRLHILMLIALLITVFTVPPVYAAEPTQQLNLTMEQAIELAIKNSKTIRQAEYNVERSEEVRKSLAEKVTFIPLEASSPEADQLFTSLVAADIGMQMAKKSKNMDEDKLIASVKKDYMAVLGARSGKEYAEKSLKNAQLKANINRVSYQYGLASKAQLRMEDSAYKIAEGTLKEADVKLENAYTTFNQTIGLRANQRPILIDQPEYAPLDVDDIEIAIVRILDGSPAIWLAEQNAQLSDLKLRLYNWGDPTREPYKAKQIDVEKAELSAMEVKEQLRGSLREMYHMLRQLEEGYALAEEGLNILREDFRVKELMHELGLVNKADYLNAELELAKAENELKNLIYKHETLKLYFEKPWAYVPGT
jgi:outer membrane protein